MSPTLAKEYWHLLEVDSVIQEWAEKWIEDQEEHDVPDEEI